MLKYGSKRDKSLATKGWAARDGLSVQETECLMDVELDGRRIAPITL